MAPDAPPNIPRPGHDSTSSDDAPTPQTATSGVIGVVSPQEFYRAAVQREDIRRILAALTK
jgi:hypothetical protein